MPTPLDTRRADDNRITSTVSGLLNDSESSGALIASGAVEEILHALRVELQLDAVFVAQFIDGQRVFRFVDRDAAAPPFEPGLGHPLEASLCQRVVDGRLPEFIADVGQLGPEVDVPPLSFRMGTHIGTPVVLKDGSVFGTLCCFSLAPQPAVQPEDMATLRHCARLVARKLELADAHGLTDPPADSRARGASAPRAPYESAIWNLRGAWGLSQNAQRAWLDS